MAKRKKKDWEHEWIDRDGNTRVADVHVWHDDDGRPYSPVMPTFDPEAIEADDDSMWRYAANLPLEDSFEPIRLGEGWTPLIPASLVGMTVHCKLEFLQPTGSYKDRGAALLATALQAAGVRGAVEDSSGNAGAAMSAYLARAGVPLSLFVPESVAQSIKVRQSVACGAEIDHSAETREGAAELAQDATTSTIAYGSHVFSPYFLAGQMTMAWEIHEQLGDVPDNIVVPVGNGLALLGLSEGFRVLREAGVTDKKPKLFGVQPRACSPVYDALMRGADEVHPGAVESTIAQGLQIADPPRAPEILAAIRDSEGTMLNVSESEIRRGMALAANLGWFIEPSASVAVAGVVKLDKRIDGAESVVVPLTGTGLKL